MTKPDSDTADKLSQPSQLSAPELLTVSPRMGGAKQREWVILLMLPWISGFLSPVSWIPALTARTAHHELPHSDLRFSTHPWLHREAVVRFQS
jgi:hypothetical protein